MLLTVKSAAAEDEQAVVALWHACDLVASYNDPVADFRFAKAGPCSDVLVAVDDAGEVAGSVMVGHDGHRGWLYYVAARPSSRSKGVGRRMVQAARDHGADMTPAPLAAGLGLGLPLIAALTSSLTITEPEAGGTEISMTFSLRETIPEP